MRLSTEERLWSLEIEIMKFIDWALNGMRKTKKVSIIKEFSTAESITNSFKIRESTKNISENNDFGTQSKRYDNLLCN